MISTSCCPDANKQERTQSAQKNTVLIAEDYSTPSFRPSISPPTTGRNYTFCMGSLTNSALLTSILVYLESS